MTLSELQDYTNWIGKSPKEVRDSVIAAGGWAKVFPEKLPVWASRVRNYFNETPNELKLLDETAAKKATNKAVKVGILDGEVGAALALSGDVYQDRSGRFWFQMVTGGTVFHYVKKPDAADKAKAAATPQSFHPVFKLVSPDPSGGSSELVVNNPQVDHPWEPFKRGESTIGAEGKWKNIQKDVVINAIFRGTYNYSETVVMGFAAHDLRDIQPHKAAADFYLNPVPGSKLEDRKFPEKDPKGKPLATQ